MINQTLPSAVINTIVSLPKTTVDFGFGGIELFNSETIAQEQIGYSVSATGESFCGDKAGSWKSNWLVVGRELVCGDPLILDTSKPKFSVLTAEHGTGSWDAKVIAPSFEAFAASLKAFSDLAQSRTNPVELENNPITAQERSKFLEQLSQLNQLETAIDFWEDIIEDDEDED